MVLASGRRSDSRADHLPAALVLMPEGSAFRSWYSPPMWAQIQGFLNDLGCEFTAPLINARDWVADEDFYDSHHMFAHGAAVFTERFGPEVLAVVRQGMKKQLAGNCRAKVTAGGPLQGFPGNIPSRVQ